MAKISVRLRNGTHHVTLTGRLTADDLRRLERACGPAIERKDMPLELDLTGTTAIDQAAQGFIDRLVHRGARLVGGAGRT